MNPSPLLNAHNPAIPLDTVRPSVLRPLTAAAALGLLVFYGVAFADLPAAHNAAHDVRHITVKPCH